MNGVMGPLTGVVSPHKTLKPHITPVSYFTLLITCFCWPILCSCSETFRKTFWGSCGANHCFTGSLWVHGHECYFGSTSIPSCFPLCLYSRREKFTTKASIVMGFFGFSNHFGISGWDSFIFLLDSSIFPWANIISLISICRFHVCRTCAGGLKKLARRKTTWVMAGQPTLP